MKYYGKLVKNKEWSSFQGYENNLQLQTVNQGAYAAGFSSYSNTIRSRKLHFIFLFQ